MSRVFMLLDFKQKWFVPRELFIHLWGKRPHAHQSNKAFALKHLQQNQSIAGSLA